MLQEENKLWKLFALLIFSICNMPFSYLKHKSDQISLQSMLEELHLLNENKQKSTLKIMTKVLEDVYTRQLEENETAGYIHASCFLRYAAAGDQGVVQERKGFLTPTILLLCTQIFYLAKNTIFKCNNNYHAHIKLRQKHSLKH